MKQAAALGAELRVLAGVLGLGQIDPEVWFRSSSHVMSPDDVANDRGTSTGLSNDDVQRLVDARAAARAAKNWAAADRRRDELAAAGIIVEDKAGGKATWRRK
jgi:cysteinyl-tRNA synthetase